MTELQRTLDAREPEEALTVLAEALTTLLPILEEEARLRFLLDLVEERHGDKLTSMVHL